MTATNLGSVVRPMIIEQFMMVFEDEKGGIMTTNFSP